MASSKARNNDNQGPMALTLHQPWASLMVYGIKRIEGRTWNTDYRGELYIHSASVEPDPETIKEVEEKYRQVYSLDGVEPIFPKNYPISALLGCVNVVDVVTREEFDEMAMTLNLTDSMKIESESEVMFLCENPRKLVLPVRLSGQHKLWKLEGKTLQSAKKGLRNVEAPVHTTFPKRR